MARWRIAIIALSFAVALASTVAFADDASPDAGAGTADAAAVAEPPASPPDSATANAANETKVEDEAKEDSDEKGEKKHKKKHKKHKKDKKDKKDKKKNETHEQAGDSGGDVGGDLVAQDDVGGVDAHQVNFRFLLQPRYTQTFVHTPLDGTRVLDPRFDDGYAMNRAFLRATADPFPWLSAKLLADFAELQHRNPKHALKLAYGEIKPDPHVSVMIGLFKRSYSLLELLPIADYELANVGPTDELMKNAELGGRDVGAMVRWSPLRKKKWLSLDLGAFGSDIHGVDARPWSLMTARIAAEPTKHWRLGIDGAWRQRGETPPSGVPANPGKGRAISADATWRHKRYELRAEWLWGTRSDEANAGQAKTWMAAWGIAAMRFPIPGCLVLMPAVRFEWLDADREHPIGRRYYMSGAFNVMNVTDNVRFLLDVTRSQVQRGSFPLSITPVLLDTSSTIVVAQMQLKI